MGEHENLTLERLLQHPRVASDAPFQTEVQQKIKAARKACDTVLTWRRKAIAHLDLETLLAGPHLVLPSVTRAEVEEALRLLADAFNTVDSHLFGRTTAFEQTFSPPGDAESLIRCLEYSEKWKAYQVRLLQEGRYEGGL
jgi:hypothetical protein